MATNIGALFPPFHYKEWRILPEAEVGQLASDVMLEVLKAEAAFFGDFGSLSKALGAWEKGITFNAGKTAEVYRAICYHNDGRDLLAKDLLQRLRDAAESVVGELQRSREGMWIRDIQLLARCLRLKLEPVSA